MADQLSLFQVTPGLPDGFRYRPDLIDEEEERALVAEIERLPFKEFEFHGFLGKRRVVSFGWRYDFGEGKLREAPAIPEFFFPVREKAARFAGLEANALEHLLVTEYEFWRIDRLAQGSRAFRRRDRNLSSGAVCVPLPQKGWRRLGAGLASPCAPLRLPSPRPCASRLGAQHSRGRAAPLFADATQFQA